MKKIFLLYFFFANVAAFAQTSAKSIYDKVVNSTVTIETDENIGSGFFVRKDLIVTNFHVVQGANNIDCYIANGEKKFRIVSIYAADQTNDLVILNVSGVEKAPVKFARVTAKPGEKIYVIGSPKGLPATISDGIVSATRNFDGKKLIQITAPISSGSSGGPVLNSAGELIGISVSQLQNGQNINFAIDKVYLEQLLNNSKNSVTSKDIKASTSPTKEETENWIIEKIESFSHNYNNSYSSGTYMYQVSFQNGDMILKHIDVGFNQNAFTGNWDKDTVVFAYVMPIRELTKLTFSKVTDDLTNIIFRVKSNDTKIIFSIKSSKHPTLNKKEQVAQVQLYIPNDLLKNNLSERLSKAFENLFVLYGGKILKEVF